MNKPSVLLDTTVFCGALVQPHGYNMRVLKLGSTPLYRPVILQSVVAEFIHKAIIDGIGRGSRKRYYTPEEVQTFLQAFGDILDPKEAKNIGQTYDFVSGFPSDTPSWVVISKFTDVWPSESDISKKLNYPIGETDLGDFHIALGVVKYCPKIFSNIEH